MQILLSDETALPSSVPFDLKALKEALLKALEKDKEGWERKEPLSVWWRFFISNPELLQWPFTINCPTFMEWSKKDVIADAKTAWNCFVDWCFERRIWLYSQVEKLDFEGSAYALSLGSLFWNADIDRDASSWDALKFKDTEREAFIKFLDRLLLPSQTLRLPMKKLHRLLVILGKFDGSLKDLKAKMLSTPYGSYIRDRDTTPRFESMTLAGFVLNQNNELVKMGEDLGLDLHSEEMRQAQKEWLLKEREMSLSKAY
jgi:hypothetical protein